MIAARRARAVYDVLVAIVRGGEPTPASLALACAAPHDTWARIVAAEGCGAQVHALLARLEHAAQGQRAWHSALPAHARYVLRGHAEAALRQNLRLHPQLAAVLEVADATNVRLMALKGAARLLAGTYRELRSTNDIDLLVVQGSAEALHGALRQRLGYGVRGVEQPGRHHLAPLTLAGSMEVELHTRISRERTLLGTNIRDGARAVRVGEHTLLVPAPTQLFLHTLEHAVLGNWSQRHRLRDVLDVAASWTPDVAWCSVEEYVRSSDDRHALEVALSAAGLHAAATDAESRRAWGVVERAGHTRAVAMEVVRHTDAARRIAGFVAVASEGSLANFRRLTRSVLHRSRRALRMAIVLLVVAGCSDSTGPVDPPDPFPTLPSFIFVSDELGADRLYRWNAGVVTLIEGSHFGDTDPHSAGGKLVFTSSRDGNPEVYASDLNAMNAQRLTSNAAFDGEARLSPDGARIAFVSARNGGVHRLFVMNADGSDLDSLDTERPPAIAERAPAWSPDGGRLAFTSVRSGTSQVWIVDAAGGTPVQVTSESGGAFNPIWSRDGQYIVYVEGSGIPRLRRIRVATGAYEPFAFRAGGLGAASCDEAVCLTAAGAYDDASAIVAVLAAGGADTLVLSANHAFAHPAIIVP